MPHWQDWQTDATRLSLPCCEMQRYSAMQPKQHTGPAFAFPDKDKHGCPLTGRAHYR